MDPQVLLDGLQNAFQPINLWWLIFGAFLGTIIGILPGLGPATGIAVLIPLTFGMEPTSALILMAAIYYGSMYGGSRSSILINTPGDGSAIAATFDGYPLSKKGQAGEALAISAIASLIGGTIAVIGFVLLSGPLANLALQFGPNEFFFLLLFALAAFISSTGDLVKAYASVFLGLLISSIGVDLQTGVYRFTMNVTHLIDGINFLVIIIGLYALGEVLYNMLTIHQPTDMASGKHAITKKWFTKEQWKSSRMPTYRGGLLGFIVGVLPGAGAVVASLLSYSTEKKLSKNPERFGKGAVEGLSAPESANSSASVGSMIPMLTLGIPGSGATAVMLGALIMIGVTPGPLLFDSDPLLISTLANSMFIGNIILVIINILLIGLFVKILKTPAKVLYPLIIVLSFIGAYTLGYSTMDFYIVIVFGILGLMFKILDFPIAPLLLAVIIGSDLEENFRRAVTLSESVEGFLFSSTLTTILFIMSVVTLLLPAITKVVKRKKTS